jgi:hypothetical protein
LPPSVFSTLHTSIRIASSIVDVTSPSTLVPLDAPAQTSSSATSPAADEPQKGLSMEAKIALGCSIGIGVPMFLIKVIMYLNKKK